MREVTLKQLRSYAAVVDAGTYAAAAGRLHVTAPAVTQQVRLLERRIGLALFSETDGRRRPTDAGRELLATMARMQAELDTCERNLQLIRDSRSGTIAFGAVSTAKYFAPGILAQFWRRHPGVDVRLTVGNRDEILGRLGAHELDVAIMGRPPEDLDLVTEVIGEHPSVVIAPPGHPLVGRHSVPLAELRGHRLLIREIGSGTRKLTESLFAAAGLDLANSLEITSNETLKQAVMAGLGVALISAHTIAAEIADGRLAVLAVEGTPVLRHWHAVRRANRHPSPVGLQFWRFVVRHGGEHLPQGQPWVAG